MTQGIYRSLFWGVAKIGRPFGGIPPRRVTHWLATRGFGRLDQANYRWQQDEWGSELRLNPYYYLDRNILAFGSYSANIQHFIVDRVKPGMICMDVGANIGEMALHLGRRVGPTGRVYAFEPVPHVRARLEAHVARNGLSEIIKVCGVALSDRIGSVEMAVAPEETQNQGMGSIVNNAQSILSNRFTVPTTTLDAFVESEKISRIDVMKIDIQGAEPLLLDGGKEVFKRMAIDFVMEISEEDLAGMGRTGKDLMAQVEGYGYSVYELLENGKAGRRVRAADVGKVSTLDNVICTKSQPSV